MSDELLHETIGRLEQQLAAERVGRYEAEATLAALRCVVEAEDRQTVERALGEALRPLLHYQRVVLLVGHGDPPGPLHASVADHPSLAAMRWSEGPLRRRVLAGQAVALYDVRQTPELAEQLDAPELRSLLCVPLSTDEHPALLIGAHAQPAFFTARHVTLARGFAQTARRVLDTLDARDQAHQRQIAEARALALTRNNEALREQLLTIQAQRHQIQRLRAPLMVVERHTLVVPLVGELDHDALLDVTESVLHAIAEHHARTIIVDLTGFESTTADVAERLASLARTTASLGARCLLSGLSPRLAIALARSAKVGLQTHATLADALASLRRAPP